MRMTIPALFAQAVENGTDRPALGTIHEGHLQWRTWQDLRLEVDQYARLLRTHQVQPGDRVGQVSENCQAWIAVDLAILSLGAVHVPMHVSLAASQLVDQIRDCDAQVVLLSPAAQSKFKQKLDTCCTVLLHTSAQAKNDPATPIENFAEAYPNLPSANDLATLIYTSGTTGKPRGVMLSHQNLTSNAISVTQAVGTQADETRLCFLPFSHIYARTCDLYSWLFQGSQLVLAENRETIVRDCQIASPSVINGVPYFYQKLAEQLQDAKSGTLESLLGGRIKRCFCGGAAVAPEVESLFEQQGLPLLSGYGLTEASPVVTATSLENYQAGSVGRPLPGIEVHLSDDHEILVRGPGVMQGYWRDPLATQNTLAEGWLKTGDLGQWSASGNLTIAGRAKELIVLTTGKNVSPTQIENLLVGSPYVESVCVVGDGRKCLAALIVPNPAALRTFIQQKRLWVWSRRRAVTHPRVHELFRSEIDRLLAGVSRAEQVGPFAILDRNFALEQGEITTKLSLRRSKIAANFSHLIESIYR